MNEKPNKAFRQKSLMKYWFLKTTFYDFLFSTKKYSELYKTRVAFLSLMLAVASTALIWVVLRHDTNGTFLVLFQNLLVGMMAGFVSLLGFVIGGLALVSGTISNDSIKYIDNEGKSDSLIGLLFSFCFHGGVIIIAILCLTIAYFMSIIPSQIIPKVLSSVCINMDYVITVAVMLLAFICYFAITYSITLLMTCLRLFLLKYKNSDNN